MRSAHRDRDVSEQILVDPAFSIYTAYDLDDLVHTCWVNDAALARRFAGWDLYGTALQ